MLLLMFVTESVKDPILVQIAGDPVVGGSLACHRTEDNQDEQHHSVDCQLLRSGGPSQHDELKHSTLNRAGLSIGLKAGGGSC